MMHCNLLIIGAGAAGMSAALSAWDSGCKDILLVDRASRLGGVLPQCIHEGFGQSVFGRELTGPDYAARLADRLRKTDVRILLDTAVLRISQEKTALFSRPGIVDLIHFEQVILASGCREKGIGSLPISGTRPAGIFTAGQAQEMINLRHQNLGDEILILGSGDLGMIMARRFVLEGKHVIAVLEQNGHYGGMARNYHRCIEAFQIPILYHTTVAEVHGRGRISGVTTLRLDSGARERVPCDTLVTALGLIPEQELIRGLEQNDWLALAGNCRQIHEIVDSAAAEAERIGRSAASRLRNTLSKEPATY